MMNKLNASKNPTILTETYQISNLKLIYVSICLICK